MSKNVDEGDFYYEGQEVARRPYYVSARSPRASYNKARVDIRPNAAPIEVSDDFFGFMFGSKPATISSPSDRRLPDYSEIRNSSLDEESIVESSINDFESGVRSLSKNAEQYENRLDKIEDEVVSTYKDEGAHEAFFDDIFPRLREFSDNVQSDLRQADSSLSDLIDQTKSLSVNKDKQQDFGDFEYVPDTTMNVEEEQKSDHHKAQNKDQIILFGEAPLDEVDFVNMPVEEFETISRSMTHTTLDDFGKEVLNHKGPDQAKAFFQKGFADIRKKLFSEKAIVEKKVELTYRAVDNLMSEEYILSRQNFFYRRLKSNTKPDIPMSIINEINDADKSFVLDVLNFLDTKLKPPDGFKVPKIVYCTSGGGKTTMISRSNNPSDYLDVDDVVMEFYEEFTIFKSFLDKLKEPGPLMDKFFKYMLHNYPDIYDNKILVMCHPKQVPHYMRGYGNELILVPVVMNWNVRFFRYNYFSLLGIMGKPKILAHYDEYEVIVRNHFNYPSN